MSVYRLSDCVKAPDGTVYCWDCTNDQMVKIQVDPVSIKAVPEEVLTAFVAHLAGVKNEE